MISEMPSSLYKLSKVDQLSLDWFAYLQNDLMQVQQKHLKGAVAQKDSNDLSPDGKKELQAEIQEAKKSKLLIDRFIDMMKYIQILEMKNNLEERQRVLHKNPQQDDFEP